MANRHHAVAYFDGPRVRGTVRFLGTPQRQRVTFDLTVRDRVGRPAARSTHAIHVHRYGDLTDGCTSTGPHYGHGPHGHLGTPDARHAGDLVNNFTTDGKGRFRASYDDPAPDLARRVVGRAVVIHSGVDDLGLGGLSAGGRLLPYGELDTSALRRLSRERGYPATGPRKVLLRRLLDGSATTGNAGGRLACAVVGLANPAHVPRIRPA